MTVVVGFNWPVEHDNAVGVIVDGELVFASEEGVDGVQAFNRSNWGWVFGFVLVVLFLVLVFEFFLYFFFDFFYWWVGVWCCVFNI